MGTKYDYPALKQQYIQTPGLSIRELCRQNDIPTWSTVNAKAKAENWDALRDELQRQVENKSLEALADKQALKIVEIRSDILDAIHMGVLKMMTDVDAREPVYENGKVLRDKDGEIVWRPVRRFGPAELEVLVKQLLALTGQPSQINENRNLNANLNSDMDANDLRAILAAIRPRAALSRGSGTPEDGDPSRTRPN